MSALAKQDKQYTPAKWQAMVTAIAECQVALEAWSDWFHGVEAAA
jgi:hypothetical protein